jgi:hypothetical protein
LTYCSFTSIQFPIYECTVEAYKKKYGQEVYQQKELSVNCMAGFLAGAFGGAFTNGFEAVTVAKQTNPKIKISELIKQDGM